MSISVDDSIRHALTVLDADASASGTPAAYIRAIRTGAPGSRHRITVNGIPAHITIQAQSPGPRRDAASFAQLIAAMAAATTDGIQPELPAEIGMVVWQHQDREVRICAPGTAPAIRRARKRLRDRLTALSPLPLLGALTQPLAGSATAVGIAVAPVIPPVNAVAPPPAHVREATGQFAGTSAYALGTLSTPGMLTWAAPALPSLPAPTDAATADHETTTPVAPDRQPRVMPSAPSAPSTPSGEASTPAVEVPVSVEPSPTVTGDGSGALVDPTAPVEQPTDTPTNAVTTEAAMSPTPTVSPLRRLLQPHHRHKRHPLHGLHGHR